MGQKRVDQRVIRVARRRMHDQPGRLVDDDEVRVLEQHHQLHRLRLGARRHRRRDAHVDAITGAQARTRLGRAAVDLDQALVDQAAHLRAGQRPLAAAQRLGQELIQPGRVLRAGGSDVELPALVGCGLGYQIFDLTCPLDFTRTSTRARS